jgi:hypothetical protein
MRINRLAGCWPRSIGEGSKSVVDGMLSVPVLCMAISRIVVLAFAVCACTSFSQDPAKGTLTVEVTDQTGARIPTARITIAGEAAGSLINAMADSNGQATIHLNRGTYVLRVQASGFMTYEEREIEVKAETHRDVTLRISQICEPIVVQEGAEIPPDRQQLAGEIPLISMQQFSPTAKPLRRKSRWF